MMIYLFFFRKGAHRVAGHASLRYLAIVSYRLLQNTTVEYLLGALYIIHTNRKDWASRNTVNHNHSHIRE